MTPISIVLLVIQAYILIIVLNAVLSWFPSDYGSGLHRLQDFTNRLTQPIVGPIRKLIPPIGGGRMAIDLSPLFAIIALEILEAIISRF